MDANGILQTVTYTADDQNGFRVRASNLPQPPKNDLQTIQDTPEVATAKKNHLEELQKSQLEDPSNILSYKILPSYFSFAQLTKNDEKNLAVQEVAVSGRIISRPITFHVTSKKKKKYQISFYIKPNKSSNNIYSILN